MIKEMGKFILRDWQKAAFECEAILKLLLFIVTVFTMTSCAAIISGRENLASAFPSAVVSLVGVSAEEDLSENQEPHSVFIEYQQSDFSILFAFPTINVNHLRPQNDTERNLAGFWGFGVDMKYFYRNNRSLQLRSDAMIHFLLPLMPGPPPPGWSIPFALNVSLTDNFYINRFRLGYGLNFTRDRWNFQDEESVWTSHINNSLGLALSTHYRFGNHFYFGVIYRPSFLELSRRGLMYEHIISLDFTTRISFDEIFTRR